MKPLNGIPQKPGTQLHIRLDERLRVAIQPGQGEPTEYTSFDEAAMNLQFDQATARRLGRALLRFAELVRPRSAETAELFSGKVSTRAPKVLPKENRDEQDLQRRKLQVQYAGATTRIDLMRRRVMGGARAKITPADIDQLAQDVELLANAPKRWAVIHALGKEVLIALRRDQQPQQQSAAPAKSENLAAEVAT